MTDDKEVQLNQWMTLLRDDIRENVPIIYLAIPGSHDSMTYGINRKSKLAPDADKELRFIYKFFPFFVRRWAKTQKFNVTEQLNNGIRYFDLRISKKENFTKKEKIEMSNNDNPDIYYFVHALFAEQVRNVLMEINGFLEDNPKELVILDFQHFYNIQSEDHLILYRYIKSIFRKKIYGLDTGPIQSLTLSKAFALNKQLVVVYRANMYTPDLWSGSILPTPWPRATSSQRLEQFLQENLKNRSPNNGYVSQCIITPDAKYIGKHLVFSLKNTARRVAVTLKPWITEQSPGSLDDGKPHVNVIMIDFVDIGRCDLIRTIIELNNKLDKTFAFVEGNRDF